MMAQGQTESKYVRLIVIINQFSLDIIKSILQLKRINTKIC